MKNNNSLIFLIFIFLIGIIVFFLFKKKKREKKKPKQWKKKLRQITKKKIEEYFIACEKFAKYCIGNMIYFNDLSEDEINIINKSIPKELDRPKLSLFKYEYDSTTEYLKEIAREKGIKISDNENQIAIEERIEKFIAKKAWKEFLSDCEKYVKSGRDKEQLEKLKKEDTPIIF